MRAYASVFLWSLVFVGTVIKFRGIELCLARPGALVSVRPLALFENGGESNTDINPHRGSGR